MIAHEVIIVGGGPAGSAAAKELKQANRDVIILDKKSFPRVKLCAGWVTPKVFKLLKVEPDDYPYGLLKFNKLYYDFGKFTLPIPTKQYSIRRFEFDNWLHELSGVEIIQHKVEQIEEKDGYYLIDGKYKSKYLIGGGGTNCPVYNILFKGASPRPVENKIVAMEEEFEYDWKDPRCLLWFGDLKFKGYSWYVPKANGYLNVGIGATYLGLKSLGINIREAWENFTKKLEKEGLVKSHNFEGKGYTYFLRNKISNPRKGNAFIVGDALGLATLDMGEGISPAIESGILAARAIVNNSNFNVNKIGKYSFTSILFRK